MLLIAAAVIPAVFLLVRVYRADRLEKEPAGLLLRLVLLGAVSTVPAAAAEALGARLLSAALPEGAAAYALLLNLAVVGPAEEGCKYAVLYRRTWRAPEFNCQFDGVVYAVFASLGFALCENIAYALRYGMATALARAVTAVPGHACFGVFMGVWYGVAKRRALSGDAEGSGRARRAALLIPALLHGCYDFIASLGQGVFSFLFLAFVLVMFAIALRLVRRTAAHDRYLPGNGE